MFIATYGSSDNSSLLKVSDKNVSGTENGNVTTKGNVFLNQTKDTAGNQTVFWLLIALILRAQMEALQKYIPTHRSNR